ncbi:BatA domain-containing protein [Schlesneria sp.]|uniref:BatA domain-containing protein n=1 Tax=Schlesneria sp. TaxID=2762018 RepID=UPI002EEBCED7
MGRNFRPLSIRLRLNEYNFQPKACTTLVRKSTVPHLSSARELMSLLHPALLFGLGLAAIPIVLHLLLRAKPKRLIFPALRLIQQNRRQNVRRLQLRHLWLLLLRVLVIAMIVFALTRPSLPPANYGLIWREWLTLLLVAGLALATYFAVLHRWKGRNWSRNEWLTRRTFLRGGLGTAVVLGLLLGVGVPYARRVSAEIKDPVPKVADQLPVAAVLLFDNSPSMSYRQGNQSRLQAAQQIARDHLSRLPSGSKVAVTTSHDTTAPAFSLDLQAARSRIDATEIKTTSLSLNERLRTALLGQEDDRRRITGEQSSLPEDKRQDRYLREIYLFTDLTRSAWREESSTALLDDLERLKTVAVYLIDVGEPTPSNAGITGVRLSRETVPAGGPLRLEVMLSAVGAVKSDLTVEFLVGGPDGKLLKRGQQSAQLEKGVERQLTFEIPQVAPPYQQGELRIVGSDPLAIDDMASFTVRTLPPLKVLVVAGSKDAAFYWQSALDYVASARISDFRTEFRPVSQLGGIDFKTFDVIFLINLPSPDQALWKRFQSYVDAGGGLGVFLGAPSSVLSTRPGSNQIDPVSYNTSEAQSLLPAKLVAVTTAGAKPHYMDLRQTQHVLLKRLEETGVFAEFGSMEIRRYWRVDPHGAAVTVARLDGQQGSPVLLERRVGRGRVMLMSTSVDNEQWNDLVGTAFSFVFADQLTQYLAQQASFRSNFVVGDEVALPLEREQAPQKIVVRMPDFKQRTEDATAAAGILNLKDLTTIGSYQVDSAAGQPDFHSGFSIRLPTSESDLRRLETNDLDSMLGQGRYAVSRDPLSLVRTVATGRMGQEMYSFVVGLLVAVFALEQFTATYFYRTDEV